MIGLFLLGSLGTTIGILASWYILSPASVLGENAKIIAGMLTGTYTGGSVNFNAIALEYNFQKEGILYAGTVAVDNVITTLWIIVTLSFPVILSRFWKGRKGLESETSIKSVVHPEDESIDLVTLAWLFFLGFSAFYTSDFIHTFLPQIPAILILSTIGILAAQIKFIANLKGSHILGLYLMFLFLAVIGAYCELSAVAELKNAGISLLLFTGLAVFLHGVIVVLVGGLIYRDWEMIAIVSQANIGGGATAIALAESFNRKELVLPAILVGTLGMALGTYLGFLVIYIL